MLALVLGAGAFVLHVIPARLSTMVKATHPFDMARNRARDLEPPGHPLYSFPDSPITLTSLPACGLGVRPIVKLSVADPARAKQLAVLCSGPQGCPPKASN